VCVCGERERERCVCVCVCILLGRTHAELAPKLAELHTKVRAR